MNEIDIAVKFVSGENNDFSRFTASVRTDGKKCCRTICTYLTEIFFGFRLRSRFFLKKKLEEKNATRYENKLHNRLSKSKLNITSSQITNKKQSNLSLVAKRPQN